MRWIIFLRQFECRFLMVVFMFHKMNRKIHLVDKEEQHLTSLQFSKFLLSLINMENMHNETTAFVESIL